jgi:nicotinate-nucleotide adenylyltransferase
MRRGIIGGTFDPVHRGHLQIARTCLAALELDRVELVPCFLPPHKSRPGLTPAPLRLAMVALACAGDPRLVPSAREILRGGRSFTVDTLREMRAEAPGDELFFLMGADSLEELDTWIQPEEITRLARVVALNRPGHDLGRAPGFLRGRVVPAGRDAGAPGEVWTLEMPPLAVSSTEVRETVARGEAPSELVPAEVAEYIEKCGLYRGTGSR